VGDIELACGVHQSGCGGITTRSDQKTWAHPVLKIDLDVRRRGASALGKAESKEVQIIFLIY